MDIERGREVDRFRLDDLLGGEAVAQGVAIGDGSVWVSRSLGGGQIARLDPDGNVVRRWDDTFPHVNLSFADGSLWAADNGGILRIDADTNRVFKADLSGNFRVTAGGGFGWTTNEDKGVVYKVGPTGDMVAQYQTGLGAGQMGFADGILWVANHDVGTITGNRRARPGPRPRCGSAIPSPRSPPGKDACSSGWRRVARSRTASTG